MILSTKISFKRIYSIIFLHVFILISGPSCKTIKLDRISYNEEKHFYEYPVEGNRVVPLRNSRGELITNQNFNNFIVELELMKYRYPFEERMEQANSLRESDFIIAKYYSEAVQAINDERFEAAAEKIDTIRTIYPDAVKFSDGAFIEGYAYESMGKEQEARVRFSEFINYSSDKYSERFRGYKYADSEDSLLVKQRNYAQEALEGKNPAVKSGFFTPIVPKYYYNSLQPGYNFNDEGLQENKKGLYFITFGIDNSANLVLGVQYYRNLNKVFDINPGFFTSGDMSSFSLAVPMQIYKTENNRFGVKLSPFASYSNFSNITVDEMDYEVNENVFSFGYKISAGYYFMQKLSVGAYYSYHYYNKGNPCFFKSKPVNIWWTNEYDVSLYYNITKGFSLKSGIKAGEFVAGIYLSGWEMSYCITNPAFILRADLY